MKHKQFMIMYEPDRNPSPPPEVLSSCADLVPDKIGETVFSKHWLFTTLMNVIQTVEKEQEKPVNKESSPSKSKGISDEEKGKENEVLPDILELDPELEEEVCNLWDMSANSDVAHFLHEFKAVEIFLTVIDKTKSPRLLEIAVGILGNMASFNDLCQTMSTESKLVKIVMQLMGSSDAPTLVQVVRLVHTCIVNDVAGPHWIRELKENTCVIESIQHILGNSLNGDLLKGTLHLIYYILNKNDELYVQFGCCSFLEALCNSAAQLHSLGDFAGLDEVWHVLHLLCQHEEVLSSLAELFPKLHPILCDYVTKFEENDILLPSSDRIPALSAAVSVLSSFLTSNKLVGELECDNQFLLCLQKMLHSVTEKLQKGPSSTENERNIKEIENKNSCESVTDSNNLNSHSEEDISNESQSSLVDSTLVPQGTYDALLVLQELLLDFFNLVIPSLNKDSDIRRTLMQVLKTSTKSFGTCPSHSDLQNKHDPVN